MDVIELWNGNCKALIDPRGAWLTNLSDDNGDVLFPKRQLRVEDGGNKTRGGCHVCLPNFGPGPSGKLAQHGFGRTSTWQVEEQTERSVTLGLQGGAAGYEPLASTLAYELHSEGLEVTLTCKNTGTQPLRIAPGFHPYFALTRGEARVNLNGNDYDTQDLAGTEFFDDKAAMRLELQRRAITLTSDNLPTWAFWTDQLGDYVCVEPTQAGYAFTRGARDDELLQAGQTKTYELTISW